MSRFVYLVLYVPRIVSDKVEVQTTAQLHRRVDIPAHKHIGYGLLQQQVNAASHVGLQTMSEPELKLRYSP